MDRVEPLRRVASIVHACDFSAELVDSAGPDVRRNQGVLLHAKPPELPSASSLIRAAWIEAGGTRTPGPETTAGKAQRVALKTIVQ